MKEPLIQGLHMEEDIRALYQSFDDFLIRNKESLSAEVERFNLKAARCRLRYGGKSLLVAFYPFILSERNALHISRVAEKMLRLMEKTTRLFLQEPSVRKAFDFDLEQIDLIKVDPGYEAAIPCARFDSFFDGENIRFSEINTDGSSGMDGADKLPKIFLASPSIRDFFSNRRVRVFDINHVILQTLLACYRQFAGGRSAGAPRIAIVDWREVRTYEEFVAFEEFCRGQGYEAVVADPRELDYDGRALSHRGMKIDIIYRRVVSREYVERLDEVKAMTRAFKDHNVCVVGSFRSDVAFSKKIFSVLHSRKFSRFFTEDERRLVERHVPWTRSFEDSECEYKGRRIRMPDLARDEKDKLVLKPSNLYEGRGVRLGILTDRDEWEKLIESALDGDYVLQELIPMPEMPMGVWDEGLEMEARLIHLGEFVFGGSFCGFYCRAADVPVIDRASKELLVPCIVLTG